MNNTNKIIKNSMWLYLKIFIIAFIGLYTTRIFLSALGIDNYGIFGLIGGIIALVLVVNTAMVSSSQRFLSLSKGRDDFFKQKQMFSSVVFLHIITATLVMVTLILGRDVIIFRILNFPQNKINIVIVAYYVMIVTTTISILSVPFYAIIASNEDMHLSVIIEIIANVFKALGAYAISKSSYNEDEAMIFFMGVLIVTSLLNFIPQVIISNKKYPEVQFGVLKYSSKELVKEMFNFGKWNLIGITAGVFRNQGLNIAINNFFPLVFNTSYSIANQLNTQIMHFAQSTIKAVTPQIVKNYGAGNTERFIYMSELTSKISFFCLAFISIPLFILAPEVLTIWLGDYPEYTIIFLRFVFILSLYTQLGIGLQVGIQASGNIKRYQIVAGTFAMLTLPFAFFILKLGAPAFSVSLIPLIVEILISIFRLYYARAVIGISIIDYLKNVYARSIISVIIISIGLYFTSKIVDVIYMKILIVGLITIILNFITFIFIVLNKLEREVVLSKIKRKFI